MFCQSDKYYIFILLQAPILLISYRKGGFFIMPRINKARYWVGVLYPENMITDWQDEIGDLLQLPFAYCVHNKDKTSKENEDRKEHVHLIIVFSNTTTYNHAMSVFSLLSAEGKNALNKIEAVVSIRQMYEYLIHNTDTCRAKGKYEYSPKERIIGNNFDIGAYEQLSIADKNAILKELCDVIITEGYTNFKLLYLYVMNNYDDSNYFDTMKSNTNFLAQLIKANYHEKQEMQARRLE